MHRHLSKLVPLALVAAIGVGLPALAKSIQSRKHVASRDTRDRDAQRVRGLSSGGSLRRAPTFGVPNPNSPALAGGHGYNANLYVY